jgi:hypothetical protein
MPEEFEGFAYIDINNPMAAWNVVRSSFYSPSCLLKSEQAGALSFSMAELLRLENAARAAAEFKLDDYRKRNFPSAISRLTGIFIFDDIDSAARIWSSEAWSAHFTSDFLTDVGVSADCSSRVDAAWISKMRDENNILAEGWEVMAEKYWSGEPASEEPIWERIIEGWVTVWGLDLKCRALAEIKRHWPKSLSLLEVAANSAAIGSRDGAVLPYAILNNGLLTVSYYLRMVDAHDPEFCERLGRFLREGGSRVCRLDSLGDSLVLPDFSCYSFERRIGDAPGIWQAPM